MATVAVAGATGQVGAMVVEALRGAGHDAVALSRSTGVDLLTGAGLDEALVGVDAVIDVVSTADTEPERAIDFFTRTSDTLLAAEAAAGVRHHVLLSIVNVTGVDDNGHYLGKAAQERRVESGPVPWTILRATQFHSFAAMVAGWATSDGVATVAPLLVQPVAVADVADVLVELALGESQGRAADLAGPHPHDLVDLARRTLAARGDTTTVRAGWQGQPFGTSMAGEVLLPGAEARIAPTTFDRWLAREPGPRRLAETYYDAWSQHDWGRLRAVLAADATFRGPLGTADSGDECLAGLQGMSTMMSGLQITRMLVDGPDVITWYELHTTQSAPTSTVNWMRVEDGLIARINVVFDPRGILGDGTA